MKGFCDNRFTLRVTHSIDEKGVGIIDQAGDGHAATGIHKLLITGKRVH